MNRNAILLIGASAAFLLARPSSALDKRECANAYEQAQVRQRERKLVEARTELQRCMDSSCPQAARLQCLAWLEQVERSLSSIVVDARSADGTRTFDVRVSVDGKVVAERLDGSAIALDAGMHRITFERAGASSVTKDVATLEGEKNRVVEVIFSDRPETPRRPEAPAPEPRRPEPEVTRPTPPAVYALGGLGVVSAGAFTILALSANKAERDLEETCAPDCSQAQADSVRNRYRVADVALAVSVVSFGSALVIYWTRPEKTAPSVAVATGERAGTVIVRVPF